MDRWSVQLCVMPGWVWTLPMLGLKSSTFKRSVLSECHQQGPGSLCRLEQSICIWQDLLGFSVCVCEPAGWERKRVGWKMRLLSLALRVVHA